MGILEFLKNNENARKIFGKRELKIIEKQLLGMNLTQSEKNRLSRDIRKKLDFIRGIAKYENEFELRHGGRIKKEIDNAKEAIKNDVLFRKVKKIVLFGSTVERLRHLGSDIDIAVEFDSITEKEAFEFRMRVAGRVSNIVDIQVYNVLPKKLKDEIDKSRRILYKK